MKQPVFPLRHAPKLAVLFAALLQIVSPALAHGTGDNFQGGFLSGFTHPLLGLDHVAAMVAVGVWGAFLRQPAIWILPVVFPIVMALGGGLGILSVSVPYIEPGIAASSIVIGLCILAAWRAPLWLASLIVGIFAIFHGHAHGTELPHAADPTAYSIGFVVSTGLLHLVGIGFGLVVDRPGGRVALRGAGGLIAVSGVAFLFGLL